MLYSGHKFDRWVGDLKGQRFSRAFVKVDRDIEATAYFYADSLSGKRRPCYDSLKGIYNPLKEMSIAPTSEDATNYIGSTFGKTRNRGTKNHNGLDLYAPEGTPIFASYDGVISVDKPFIYEQPNRDSNSWPIGYKGNRSEGGNRFYLDCEINGAVISFGYMHLQAGGAIAINPRTKKTFKQGDKVYAGEIIGYTGRTGNAYNVDYTHLHIVVLRNGSYVNPEDYINGELQWDNNSKTRLYETAIINIKCDDE